MELHTFYLIVCLRIVYKLTPVYSYHLRLVDDRKEKSTSFRYSSGHKDGTRPSLLGRHVAKEGTRPVPSNTLPIVDLLENPSRSHDPKRINLRMKILRKYLGDKFDHKFMSVNRPTASVLKPNGSYVYNFRKGHPVGAKPKFLKSIGVQTLVGGPTIKLKVSKKLKKRFQKYIWGLTYCPVKHTWKDLGVRFWPRWIKEGSCDSSRSCSIPPGMKCKASQSTNKTLLRWHCRGNERTPKCQWIHIQYPVLTQCSCSC